MHRGTVTAESAGEGLGSEFVITLPISVSKQDAVMSGTSVTPTLTQKVLIVDDNRDAADTLSVLLSEFGATTSIAYSGQQALDAIEQFDPDVVLLDIGMPTMDGYEVSRRIRASLSHREVLIIALTGWGQERDRRQSRAAGIDHHLVKPPDVRELVGLMSLK